MEALLRRVPSTESGVCRESDIWVINLNSDYYTFEELPQYIKEPLAVLLTCPVGFYNKLIGRRVTEDVLWVYHS